MTRLARTLERVALLAAALILAQPAAASQLDGVSHEAFSHGAVRDVLWIDLDGDGDGDLASAEHDRLRLFRNDAEAGLVEITRDALDGTWPGLHAIASADLEDDGDPDLVVCPASPPGSCRILLNRFAGSGEIFLALARELSLGGPRPAIPLLVDHDGDRDPDLFLFARRFGPSRLLRNDVAPGGELSFTLLPLTVLPSAGPTRGIVPLDPEGREIHVARSLRRDQLLVWDPEARRYRDEARARGLPASRIPDWPAAAADFDRNGRTDLLAHVGWRHRIFLQDQDGRFHDRTAETGLGAPERFVRVLETADFDRNGRPDVFVGRSFGASRLLLNFERPGLVRDTPGAPPPPHFVDAAAAAGVAGPIHAADADVFLRVAECDFDVDLAVGSARRRRKSVVHRFPDDSLGNTIFAEPGRSASIETRATHEGGCVVGSAGRDHLVGHRVSSVLSGGDGPDVLVARAGLTVMQGGRGMDRFEAAGVSIVRLPLEEIDPGDTIHCNGASQVVVDSPLSLDRLITAGVVFEDCFEEGDCGGQEPIDITADRADENEAGFFCHEAEGRVQVGDLQVATPFAGLQKGFDLDLDLTYGTSGYGTCQTNADCHAIGLDVCRTIFGAVPGPGETGQCYPSSFDGHEGPLPEWCRDPFWARLRFDQVQSFFVPEERWFVVPMTVWLPRSDAVTSGNGCPGPGAPPRSIPSWHGSLVDAMEVAHRTFGKWRVRFDTRFFVFDVPSHSAFVGDPEDDPCRTDLEYPAGEANSIGELLEDFPGAYVPGEVNVYLSDNGRKGTGASWSDPVRFILLHENAGALTHELGHELRLPHPFDDNESATLTEPNTSESRDSWNARPFPDPGTDRLHLCAADADCKGFDAGDGDCRKAPAALLGYCRNLKQDCAQDGDRVCDTPWDTVPCFQGISTRLGEACEVHADCQSDAGQRGVSYKTACLQGFCRKVECSTSDDCGGGSFCADGACVNWKPGYEACCDLHTETIPGLEHNHCWERRPNGDIIPVPGVGNATSWPIHNNRMAYHSVGDRRPRGFTAGQRDLVVCDLSYTNRYGPIQVKGNAVGEPCSLRPGATATSYGPAQQTGSIPHGACASGVCELASVNGTIEATCAPSSCNDGVISGDEAGTDCGGPCPDDCGYRQSCFADADCGSGLCIDNVCDATCSDGTRNGGEVVTDAGGAGYEAGCSGQAVDERCRLNEDCNGALICRGKRECVMASDCPVNDDAVPCLADGDCPFGGECVALKKFCANPTCAFDVDCPDSFCDITTNRCGCDTSADCPVAAGSCQPTLSICLDQCVDGLCLGTCDLGL